MSFYRVPKVRRKPNRQNRILLITAIVIGLIPWGKTVLASDLQSYKVVVNSDRDTIEPDAELTLREAISLVNNTLPYSKLSSAEQQQVEAITNTVRGLNLIYPQPMR